MSPVEKSAEQAQMESAMRFYSKMKPEQITDIGVKALDYLRGKGYEGNRLPDFTFGVVNRDFVKAVMTAQREMKLSKVDGKWGDNTNTVYNLYQRTQAIPFKTSVETRQVKVYQKAVEPKEPVGRVEIGRVKVIQGPAATELYGREYAVGDRTFRLVSRDEESLNRSNSPNGIVRTALSSRTTIQEFWQGKWVSADISALQRALTSVETTRYKGVARVINE